MNIEDTSLHCRLWKAWRGSLTTGTVNVMHICCYRIPVVWCLVLPFLVSCMQCVTWSSTIMLRSQT